MISISRAPTILIFDFGNLLVWLWLTCGTDRNNCGTMKPGVKFLREMREEILLIIFFWTLFFRFQKLRSDSLLLCPLVNSPVFLKHTLIRHESGIIPNRELHSLKPRFCPGLPIQAILENPAKCPDPIGRTMGSETQKRTHSGLFKTRVFCPFHERSYAKTPCEKRCPPNCNKMPWKAF